MQTILIQAKRYLTAFRLPPNGRIYRRSSTISPGGDIIDRWGFMAERAREECGWGKAKFLREIFPRRPAEINDGDLAEIIRQAESGETPREGSTAYWYLDHLPYWRGINWRCGWAEGDARFRAEAFYLKFRAL